MTWIWVLGCLAGFGLLVNLVSTGCGTILVGLPLLAFLVAGAVIEPSSRGTSFVLLLVCALAAWNQQRRHAAQLRAWQNDKTSPILLLRSFRHNRLAHAFPKGKDPGLPLMPWLFEALVPLGKVILIGGDRDKDLHERWWNRVALLHTDSEDWTIIFGTTALACRAVLVIPETSLGLLAEMRSLAERGLLGKTFVFMPPCRKQELKDKAEIALVARWNEVAGIWRENGIALPDYLPGGAILRLEPLETIPLAHVLDEVKLRSVLSLTVPNEEIAPTKALVDVLGMEFAGEAVLTRRREALRERIRSLNTELPRVPGNLAAPAQQETMQLAAVASKVSGALSEGTIMGAAIASARSNGALSSQSPAADWKAEWDSGGWVGESTDGLDGTWTDGWVDAGGAFDGDDAS